MGLAPTPDVMRVLTEGDGSIRFVGDGHEVRVDTAERRVLEQVSSATVRVTPFEEVYQVGLVGPPKSFLAVHLQRTSGSAIELGYVASPDVGYRLASTLANTLGCAFGGIVRLGTPLPTDADEGPTAWMELIQEFTPPGFETRESPMSAQSTEEVTLGDILSRTGNSEVMSEDEPTEASAHVDMADTVEMPTLSPIKSGAAKLLADFDDAVEDLLQAHADPAERRSS